MVQWWEEGYGENDNSAKPRGCSLISTLNGGNKVEALKNGVYRHVAKVANYAWDTDLNQAYHRCKRLTQIEAMLQLSEEEYKMYEYIIDRKFEHDQAFVNKHINHGSNLCNYIVLRQAYRKKPCYQTSTEDGEKARELFAEIVELPEESIGKYARNRNILPYYFDVVYEIELQQDIKSAQQTLKKVNNIVFEGLFYRCPSTSYTEIPYFYDDIASFLYDADRMIYITKKDDSTIHMDMVTKQIMVLLYMIDMCANFYDYHSAVQPEFQPIAITPLYDLQQDIKPFLNDQQYVSLMQQLKECKQLALNKVNELNKKYGKKI